MRLKAVALITAALAATPALAHDKIFLPESHAPAGVMADHMHSEGEVMTGYRYLRTSYSGYYRGSDEVSVADLATAGFGMAAESMTMDMLMLDIMYAPTDWLTLMVMPMYMHMEMDMAPTGGGHGHHMMDMTHDMHGGQHGHEHSISGLGDTQLSALFRLAGNDHHQLIGTLGVSVPTGKVDRKNPDGSFVHYGMQLGSGTWDMTPGLAYTGLAGRLSWGAQANAVIRLEDENDSGFAFGDKYQASLWSAVRLVDWMSLSARVSWEDQDAISGHYNDAHNHSAPEDFQENYGGEFVDAALGANFVITGGNFAGLRFGLEWVSRVSEDYNGYQLGLDDGVNASISYAFK